MRRWLRYVLAGFMLSVVATLATLWFVWFSPLGYVAPADLPAIDASREHRVFVYGTLRQPLVRRLVTGEWIDTGDAVLPGCVRRGLDLEQQRDGSTEGEVFSVKAPALLRLDRYERLGIRYDRVKMLLSDGEAAWVYRRLPEDPAAQPRCSASSASTSKGGA